MPVLPSLAQDLDDVVRGDGDIRLTSKDWPLLTEASVTGAVLALAARRQGSDERACRTLMSQEGRAGDAAMRDAVITDGLDMAPSTGTSRSDATASTPSRDTTWNSRPARG